MVIWKAIRMKVSYNGLWKIFIDHKMQEKDLIDQVGISSAAIIKMEKGEKILLDVIERIGSYFDCNIEGVIGLKKAISCEG